MLQEVRGSDVLGQIEQGKFLAILAETDQEGAQVFLKRSLQHTQEFSIETGKGDLSISLQTAMLTLTPETIKQPLEILDFLQRSNQQPLENEHDTNEAKNVDC